MWFTEGGLLDHVKKFQVFDKEDNVDVVRKYLKTVDTSFIMMMIIGGSDVGMGERR